MRTMIILLLSLLFPLSAHAETKPKIIASFSIIGDMAREIAGDNIELKILVGANGDAHEYEPTPNDAKNIANADLVLINGLNLEGWIEKLIKSSDYKGAVVIVSKGSKYIKNDPHAWQNLANGKIYVENIRDSLAKIDKAHAQEYQNNAANYINKLDELDSWVKSEIDKIPPEKRNVISTHDAFQYFANAYNINFIAPIGISTQAQASAADLARLIDQIRAKKITTVFLENMSDSRLMKQLEKDAGARIGGTLYSDSLSAENEAAPTYIEMFRHNVQELIKAMQYEK
ncbi:MAG: zinc ABC transporter substrate-binding protein [Rickettsiales bacterium]|jgi:zinc/manganese transport system substrate-binding protein